MKIKTIMAMFGCSKKVATEMLKMAKAADEANRVFDAFGIVAKEAKRSVRKHYLKLWPFHKLSFGLRYWEHHAPLDGHITIARSSVLLAPDPRIVL